MAGRAWSRRDVLLAGGAGLFAGCSGDARAAGAGSATAPSAPYTPSTPSAPSRSGATPNPSIRNPSTDSGGSADVPTSARFDLSGKVRAALREVRLHEERHPLQGIGYDVVNARIFAVQGRDGRPGADLCVNELSASGEVVAHLHVDNAGHGQSFGVESVGSASYLWFESDATENSDDGRGTGIARFEFAPGRRPKARKFLSGSAEVGCAVDPVHRRLLVRRLEGRTVWYRLYRLEDAADDDFDHPLAGIKEPSGRELQPDGRRPVLQAFTALGDYAYTWLGTGGHAGTADDPFNSYLSAIDLRTGQIVQQQLITAGRSLSFREPEALAVDVVNGVPRLCFGFASRPRPGSPVRLASVYYLDALL